ncbi:hypothetical protein Hanom_Chr09g00804141 [Helianthus anomalus]
MPLASSLNPNPSSASFYATLNPNPRSPSSTRKPNHLPLLPNPHINSKTSSQNGCSSSSSSVSGTSDSGDHEELQLVVVSFYKFADFPDHADLRKPLKDLCEHLVYIRFVYDSVIVSLGMPSVSPNERVGRLLSMCAMTMKPKSGMF